LEKVRQKREKFKIQKSKIKESSDVEGFQSPEVGGNFFSKNHQISMFRFQCIAKL
jgi:hypothetical protein